MDSLTDNLTSEEKLLCRCVSIKSLSGHEGECASYLVDEMRKLGYNARIDEAGNAVGIIGAGESEERLTVLFAGHMDTVPGDVVVKVTHEYEPGVVGRTLHGRGSVDAKGPLCAFIWGASQARLKPGVRVIAVGCVEEECATSKGARHLIGKYQPDMIIIGEPSGSSAVTLGYKGRLLIDYSLSLPQVHGASPRPGSAEMAIDFYNSLAKFVEKTNETKSSGFDLLQMRVKSMVSGSDGIDDTSHLSISLRVPPGCSIDEIKKFVLSSKGEGRVEFHGEELPIKADKNNLLVRSFVNSIRAADASGMDKIEPAYKMKSGTSDMNVLGAAYPGVPILAYGPGDSSLDHTPTERIRLDEYRHSITVIKLALENLG